MQQILHNYLPEIMNIRHQIHANPELANEEFITSALIKTTLEKYNYMVDIIGGTGVVAVLDSGKPGKVVALRADIDALPIEENTELSYRSKVIGKMHACGHDGHTATLLLAAITLSKLKDRFKGKIKFIFQPAEEIGTGANLMIKHGVLENPKVDAIFGYHNTPKSALGSFKTRVGCLHAGQDVFTINIKGKGGHAAHPQLSVNPIYVGTRIIEAIQNLVNQLNTPDAPLVITVTQFHSGSTHNVIMDDATLNGTIRAITPAIMNKVKDDLVNLVNTIADDFGATANTQFSYHFPPVLNSEYETKCAFSSAKKVLAPDKIEELTFSSMASEDFSCYLEKVPGCFFG